MPSTRSGASYNPSSSCQKCYRCYYKKHQPVKEGEGSVNEAKTDKLCHSEVYSTFLPSNRAETTTISLSGNLSSQPEGLQQCTEAQKGSNPCRNVKKLHELLPYSEKPSGPSQHFEVIE
ncbi:hypothetical protein O181_092588 [Austropuccinia psidii MF-1]|uniref:Uncharacterized protein n=1 Tax=Austropuccinia psidii MF-1 TaxID=1389203 RepID=A0A9Q3P8J8_9BASI|nr:hypothetical protein [Austropuccinia psidii MF-1]